MFIKSKSGEFVNLAHVYAAKIYDNCVTVGSFRLYTPGGSVLFEFNEQNAFENALKRLELLMPVKCDWIRVANYWLRVDQIQCVKEFGSELQIKMQNDSFEIYTGNTVEMEEHKEQVEKALVSSYLFETLPV